MTGWVPGDSVIRAFRCKGERVRSRPLSVGGGKKCITWFHYEVESAQDRRHLGIKGSERSLRKAVSDPSCRTVSCGW